MYKKHDRSNATMSKIKSDQETHICQLVSLGFGVRLHSIFGKDEENIGIRGLYVSQVRLGLGYF